MARSTRPFDSFFGLGASPILAGDTLLMLCDTRKKPFLIAVDSASGKVRWRVERSDIRFEGFATPVIDSPEGQPAQAIVLGAHRIDAYAVSSGEHLWWVGGLGYVPVASPVLGKGVVVVSTFGSDGPAGPTFDELLKKLDKNSDGRLSREEFRADPEMGEMFGGMDYNSDGFVDRDEWEMMRNGAVGNYGMVAVRQGGRGDLTQTAVAWREKKTYSNLSSPLIYKNVLYMVKSGGIIASMDPLSGKVYKVGRAKDAIDEYYSSPVAADGKVIFTSESGKVAAVKAGPQWEVLAVNDLGEECYATPAIAGGKIFLRTRSALYCFGKK